MRKVFSTPRGGAEIGRGPIVRVGDRFVAASIGLGNYHNCAPAASIQCEFVSVDDYANMVRLCLAIVSEGKESDPIKALRGSLEKRADGYTPLFRKI
jgi:hypothetical protein